MKIQDYNSYQHMIQQIKVLSELAERLENEESVMNPNVMDQLDQIHENIQKLAHSLKANQLLQQAAGLACAYTE